MIAWLLALAVAVATEGAPTPADRPDPWGAATDVVLVDAGKGPKRPLRYTPADGVWQGQLTRRANTATLVGDLPPEVDDSGEMVLDLGLSADGGVAHVALVGAFADAEGPTTQLAIRQAVDDLDRATVTLPADDRGLGTPVATRLPDEVSGRAFDLLQQLWDGLALVATPLPDEPVGKGASWTWSRQTRGLTVRHTATVRSRAKRALVLDVTVAVDVRTEDDPTMTVATMTREGRGTVWLDLDQPPARAARFEIATEGRGTLHADDGQDVPFSLSASETLELVTRPTDTPARNGR